MSKNREERANYYLYIDGQAVPVSEQVYRVYQHYERKEEYFSYEHCSKSSGAPQFYRFSRPITNQYPVMIELFTRKLDAIQLPEDAVLTPLPMDEDISSLSAILLDEDYYEFLKQGKVTVDGVTVLDAAHLIPFKAKAWMDLTDRKAAGEHVDSK